MPSNFSFFFFLHPIKTFAQIQKITFILRKILIANHNFLIQNHATIFYLHKINPISHFEIQTISYPNLANFFNQFSHHIIHFNRNFLSRIFNFYYKIPVIWVRVNYKALIISYISITVCWVIF